MDEFLYEYVCCELQDSSLEKYINWIKAANLLPSRN